MIQINFKPIRPNILSFKNLRYISASKIEAKSVKPHPIIDDSKNNVSNANQRSETVSQDGVKLRKSSANYCVDLVRKHDYENFLCTLLLPDKKCRREMFAIRAFNTEIALVRDQVTQKELGLGRMFFWRDALNQLYSNKISNKPYVPKHPVVIEMSNVILGNDLSKKWMSNLLDSRERIMTDTPFKDLLELEGYCDQSITSVLYLALELLEVKNVEVDHAASHLGKAIGLSNFIRSIPFNAQRRRVLVPQELLIKNKVSQENFVRNTELEKLQEVVYEIACYAHSHYEKAKSMKAHVNKKISPIFLSGVPSLMYLNRLQKANFNPYEPSLNRRNGLLPFQLYYRKLIKSFY